MICLSIQLCGHEIEDSLDDGVAHYSSDMTAPTSQDQSGGRRLPAVNDGVRLTMAHAHNAASLKHEFNAVRRGLINVNIDQVMLHSTMSSISILFT